MLTATKRFNYAFARRCLKAWVRPTINGVERHGGEVVYALANRSMSDLALLDIVADTHGLPTPYTPLEPFGESRRFVFLNRPAGVWRRNTMRSVPARMRRLETKVAGADGTEVWLIPVSIFWGRAANKDRSWVRSLLSEGWAMSSRLRRLLIFLFNRRDILVQFGTPLAWHDIVATAPAHDRGDAARQVLAANAEELGEAARDNRDADRSARRTARLLRVKFRNQKVAALGPDLSHRRTMTMQILSSSSVTAAIEAEVADGRVDDEERVKVAARRRAQKKARKYALAIAADMSYPTVRFLDRLLTWFWHRVYEGVTIEGIDNVVSLAQTHTLVFTPCHRSHIDYLLLSYVLYHQGLMLPHIAAGDNLNMPVVGGVLRRGGAFFMRRRFRGDRIYTAVFSEYLYQVFRRGHSVEYFVEGGRTRTGRLLPARTGLLQMTLDAHSRGLPRPLAFVPVYFGYEKLVEASGYVDELRGADKQKESFGGVLRSLKLVKQSFGAAQVSFGKPIMLADFLATRPDAAAQSLGTRLLAAVNACATVNAMNLIALATLSMPRQAIEEGALLAQIDLYRDLLRRDADCHDYFVTDMSAADIVRRAEDLQLLQREATRSRDRSTGDILKHDDFTSILMTWYRNNVLHVLAAPAFIACLMVNRRRGIRRNVVRRLFGSIFPYIRKELQMNADDSADRWLAHLQAAELVEMRGDGFVAANDPTQRYRLRLLAHTVMEVLERFYIAVALLADAGTGNLDRRTLLAECRTTAERISTLYRINAPEFSDVQLFEGLLQGLSDDGIIGENADGKLVFDKRIGELLRAGQGVIAVELRQALPMGL